MWGLLLTTILTSAADSLNPIGITQQFVLQGMVKKPKHIWYFIIPTGVTNLIGGYLAYYGFITLIGNYLGKLAQKHAQTLYTAELVLGIASLIAAGIILQNRKIVALKRQTKLLKAEDNNDNEYDEEEAERRIKSVSPLALVTLGVGATISELSTALPYFAFLAILFNYQLTLLQVTFILVVYNTIYTLPLIILYFVYIRAQDKFDRLYRFIKTQIAKCANILVPAIVGIIGVILVYHSISLLLS